MRSSHPQDSLVPRKQRHWSARPERSRRHWFPAMRRAGKFPRGTLRVLVSRVGPQGEPAVHDKIRACDESGTIRGQEQCGLADIGRHSTTAQGMEGGRVLD